MNHAEMQFLTTEFPFKKQYANFIGGEWVKPAGRVLRQRIADHRRAVHLDPTFA